MAGLCLKNKYAMSSEKLRLISHYMPAESPEQIYEWIGNACSGTDMLVKNSVIPEFKWNLYPAAYLKGDIESNLMLMDLLMYHPDDILVKVDRAGMAVSLETRIPFLDRDVVEFAWKLPLKYKSDGRIKKKVLRNVLYRYVPSALMERPKSGFEALIAGWLRSGELRPWAEDLLAADKIEKQGILRTALVRKMWADFLRTGQNSQKIWYLLMFQEWMKNQNR